MSINTRIVSITASNLRCPDYAVSFTNDKGKPASVVLIQMPNGTGKTTTLQLLRAALAGPEYLESEGLRVRDFRKKGAEGEGIFEVKLLLNEKFHTFKLTLDFETEEVRYQTTLPGGQDDGFHPPTELRPFFRPDFVKLFVFDGELAGQLLDDKHTDAGRALEALFQLDLFAKVQQAIEQYYDWQTEGRGAETSKGVTRSRNQVKKLEKRLAHVKAEKEKDKKQLGKEEEKLARLEKRRSEMKQTNKRLKRLLAEADEEQEEATAAVQNLCDQVFSQVCSPHVLSASFAQEMLDFKEHLDRVKLPESASKEFFNELAEEEECICGMPLDDERREAIRTRAKHYLGSEDMNLLNVLKAKVAEAVAGQPAAPAAHMDTLLEQLQVAINREDYAKQEVLRLEQEGARENPDFEDLIKAIENQKHTVKQQRERLSHYDTPDDNPPEKTWYIPKLERDLKTKTKKLAEVANTVALNLKRGFLSLALSRAFQTAQTLLAERVRDEANELIGTLMPNNDIRIDRIDKSLHLAGQRGGSKGETLTVAYAFLSTLFSRSSVKLPFIVDSPAGSTDLSVRREIGRLVPKLADQFIAFTISSEREHFVPALAAAAPEPILYLTLFRKGKPQLEAQARQHAQYTETHDGMCVVGKPFFNQFQLDKEDGDV